MKKVGCSVLAGTDTEVVLLKGRIPIYIVGEPVINLAPRRKRTRSARMTDLERYVHLATGLIAGGQSVDEIVLSERLPGRYSAGNAIKALREVHRRYPDRVSLELIEGIWTLMAVTA